MLSEYRYGLPPTVGHLDRDWSRCRDWIQDAIDHSGGFHMVDDVYEMCIHGRAFFFPGEKSALICEVIQYPQAQVWNFWLAGGDLEELFELEKEATNFCKSLGIHRQEFRARLGWNKIAKQHGWKLTQQCWSREV